MLAEELGFIGCVAVIILFAIFIWRGLLIAMKAPDMFGSLVAVGITSLIRITSNYEYCGCNIIYAKYRNSIAIF